MKIIDFSGLPNTAVADQGPLTVAGSAVTLASLLSGAAFHANTQFVRVRFETAEIRLSTNGTTPTATLGRAYNAGDDVLLTRAEADNCKLIRTGGTSGTLQVAQYLT